MRTKMGYCSHDACNEESPCKFDMNNTSDIRYHEYKQHNFRENFFCVHLITCKFFLCYTFQFWLSSEIFVCFDVFVCISPNSKMSQTKST